VVDGAPEVVKLNHNHLKEIIKLEGYVIYKSLAWRVNMPLK
jgi:hypothetical protein